MLCDRVAASMVYLKDKYTKKSPLEYYESHRDENQFSEDTRNQLEAGLRLIAEYGDDYVFNLIKHQKDKNKNYL